MENIEQIIKQQHDYFKTLKTHEYAFRMKQLTLLYQKIKYYQKEIKRLTSTLKENGIWNLIMCQYY